MVVQTTDIYQSSRKSYGSPRITEALKAQGITCSENRVARLMRINGIAVRPKNRFRYMTDSDHSYPVAPNLLDRCFTSSKPDTAWGADITYVWTAEGWLYLAVILDLFSRCIVGWSMAAHMRTKLVMNALNMALGQRLPEKGLIHHLDCGGQYASIDYRDALDKAGIKCNMSRKGNCWDNAVAESFFVTFETELRGRCNWMTLDQAKMAIFEYIEVFYNRKGMRSTLGYKTPVEFERLFREKDNRAA